MSIQHNDPLSLDWLMPIFERYLDSLSIQWQKCQETNNFEPASDMMQQYHQLSGAMVMANLPLFSNLATALKFLILHLEKKHPENPDNAEFLINLARQAHQILFNELNKLSISNRYHQQVLLATTKQITLHLDNSDFLLKMENDSVSLEEMNDSLSRMVILPASATNTLQLSSIQKEKIQEAWLHHRKKLFQGNDNNSPSVEQLHKMVQFVWRSTENILLQRLWYLVFLWFGCLSKNSSPQPTQYQQVILLLEKTLSPTLSITKAHQLTDNNKLFFEFLIAQLYIQITLLKNIDEPTQQFLANIQSEHVEKPKFFADILQKLEQVIFHLDQPQQMIEQLTEIHHQLNSRGWSIFITHLNLVMKDLKDCMESEEAYAQLQWQIERQLQELYGSIFAMKQKIDSESQKKSATSELESQEEETQRKETENSFSSEQILRKIRVNFENIELQFKKYAHTQDIKELPAQTDFESISADLLNMNLVNANEVFVDLSKLFLRLETNKSIKLSWTVVGAVTDAIAEFELFLDYLAQQVFDANRLEHANQRLVEANDLFDEFLDSDLQGSDLQDSEDPETTKDLTVLRYDDDGEVEPVATVDAHSIQTGSNQDKNKQSEKNKANQSTQFQQSIQVQESVQSQIATTPELEKARESLKEDNFTIDEDIREIFIEEVDEVLEAMDEQLPVWIADCDNSELLNDIRRGFHTIKGSGRMVGAYNVGEMAWAVENLLNRVLDKTVLVTEELYNLLTDTRNRIPTLVNDFSNKNKPSIDPAITILKADNIFAGNDINHGIPTTLSDANNSSELVDTINNNINDNSEKIASSEQIIIAEITTDESITDQTVTNEAIDDRVVTGEDGIEGNQINSDSQDKLPQLPEVLQPFWHEAQNLADDNHEIDEDIKEIFIEEVGEVLEEIVPKVAKLSVLEIDNESLTDIRRGFHTLKGSGRMVGANHSAELAWAVENMLNRVLDPSVIMTEDMLSLMTDVLNHYPQLITTFEKSTDDYPKTLPLWVACANAYSKNHADDFSYQQVLIDVFGDNSTELDDANVFSTNANNNQKLATNQKILDSISKVNQEFLDSQHIEHKVDQMDLEFINVFVDEAYERLQIINNFVVANKGKSEIEVSDELVRSFHSLRGASGSDALQAISNISDTIETNLVYLQHIESPMNEQYLDAISHSVTLIASYLNQYTNTGATTDSSDLNHENISSKQDIQKIKSLMGTGQEQLKSAEVGFNLEELIEGIGELLDADVNLEYHIDGEQQQLVSYLQILVEQVKLLYSRTQKSKAFTSLLTPLGDAYQHILLNQEFTFDGNRVKNLVASHEQLTRLFDSLAANMALKVDAQVIENLQHIYQQDIIDKDSTDKNITEQGTTNIVSSDDKLEVDSAPTSLEFEKINTDEELLEIFLEEVQELEEDISNSFSRWKENTSNFKEIKELQRHLHTIKGGARMTGISSIGDLTHEIETIYEKFLREDSGPATPWITIMQGAHDVLSMQIEYINNYKESFFVRDIIEQLIDYSKLDEIPEGSSLLLPVFEHRHNDVETTEQLIEADQNFYEETPYTKNVEVRFNELVERSWNGTLPDEDILAVYLEEVDELIESSSRNLQEFQSNTSSLASLQALQRELHTIKGGARMVGSTGIADLSHEMETVYEELGIKRLPTTTKILDLLTVCHDWLANAVELLSNKINPPLPKPLIDTLKSFLRKPDNLLNIPLISLQEYTEILEEYGTYKKSLKGEHDTIHMPAMVGDFGEFKASADVSGEMIRVSSGLMEQMINLSGESSINRARVDMSIASVTQSIEEMGTTVQRLSDQLRRMDIELEAQILAQIDEEILLENEDFDPLEMDQYSSLNQLSKSLSESASDLLDIKSTLLDKARDSESLLLQLSRTQAELQDGLMDSRMVPFSRLIPRLQRIVRQTANELDKKVELSVLNADDEMDRTILERITSPLEHMLRNAVDHGIESPAEREQLKKDSVGQVNLSVSREGSELVIQLGDDGYGIDVNAVRNKAIKQGLIDPNDDSLTDTDVMQYIFNSGLTTTKKITQISGRGVGMDVVRSEIRQLGGSVSVKSEKGKGSRFTMRVPLTVAISDALVVRAADRHYAIPLVQIERIEQVNPDDLFTYYQSDKHTFNIFNTEYRLRYLNEILTGNTTNDLTASGNHTLPVIIIKNQTGQNLALQVDEIVGSRIEIVVKPLGKQLSHVSGVSAATIMGDGSVMLILDLMALVRNAPIRQATKIDAKQTINVRKKILVIDDSVTVRKVTSRFLEREGFDAHVAKDGVDALEILQEFTPDLMLLDIEMPRMDGFEVATQVRYNQRLKDTPIIMITSRTGEKHRERAMEIGVNDYLGKPFQEGLLLERINSLLNLGLVNYSDK